LASTGGGLTSQGQTAQQHSALNPLLQKVEGMVPGGEYLAPVFDKLF